MIDFIMLGQVPGTSIQISFGAWLIMALLISASLWAWRRHGWQRLSAWLARRSRRWQQRRELKQLRQLAL